MRCTQFDTEAEEEKAHAVPYLRIERRGVVYYLEDRLHGRTVGTVLRARCKAKAVPLAETIIRELQDEGLLD